MKKVLKTLQLLVVATAIWETVASYYKDEKFKEKLGKAEWFDKLKVIFNNLVDVNKGFLEKVKLVDYKGTYIEYKDYAESKLNDINIKLDELKQKLVSAKDEKILPFVKELEGKLNEYKKEIEEKVEDVKEKIKLEEKIKIVKSKIEEVKGKFQK